MTSTTTLELATTLDWDKALPALSTTPDMSLEKLLSDIDSYPAPVKPTKSKMPVSTELTPEQLDKVNAIPKVFRSVLPPARRRNLNEKERAELATERTTIDAVLKFLTERKEEISAMISTDFDIKAEKDSVVTDKTGVDAKGHYLIAAPGTPERIEMRHSSLVWTRQRTSDKTVPNATKLEKLHAEGVISEADYQAVTKPVFGRAIDEDAIRRLLLSADGRETAQRVLNLIGEQKRGTNSIHLRKG